MLSASGRTLRIAGAVLETIEELRWNAATRTEAPLADRRRVLQRNLDDSAVGELLSNEPQLPVSGSVLESAREKAKWLQSSTELESRR
ncbi:MAG: hypothetical protein R3C19_12195 [Planctomycetaceae bacterium]